jgi:multidrug efflux pump subunit AcrB
VIVHGRFSGFGAPANWIAADIVRIQNGIFVEHWDVIQDEATVTIENIERYLEQGLGRREAILEGAAQIAVPALVSTLCICIVFLPMFFLAGVSKFLFVPLAEAVMFAMLASYVLSRTLVPTLAMYLLKEKQEHDVSTRSVFSNFQQSFERGFERLRVSYELLLKIVVRHRAIFVPSFLAACLLAFLLVQWLGQNFFPSSDNGEFILHMRAKSGTRIEEAARLCDEIEGSIRRQIPKQEMDNVLDNIGLPYSTINFMHSTSGLIGFMHSTSGLIGAGDADILVSFKEKHHPTADYVRQLRQTLPHEFPGTTFYFLPADMVTQVLNFGIPAPSIFNLKERRSTAIAR